MVVAVQNACLRILNACFTTDENRLVFDGQFDRSIHSSNEVFSPCLLIALSEEHGQGHYEHHAVFDNRDDGHRQVECGA
ncbi:hypothetical protein Q31a_43860 [Aureliella helgolandensis]|uniref:Uncharacterized protein n=1 Tax=Aureliella helgolandensis TaxID=2527968 RepID=A0A518GBM4_9BACT|nr:hypothetical protein Q31a_43860 [Aureliella helgolandensis]